MKENHGCPVQATINVLSGKWKVQIVWHLSFGPRRFAELRRKLPKISEKVLTEQLRQLRSDGVLARKASSSVRLGQRAFWHQADPAETSREKLKLTNQDRKGDLPCGYPESVYWPV